MAIFLHGFTRIFKVGVFAIAFVMVLPTTYAAGNFFIDGGTANGTTFAGLAGLGTPSCFWARDLFKVFDTNSPQNGANVIDCYENGTITLNDGDIITKPIVLFGTAVLSIADGATVTFTPQSTTPVVPFVYVGTTARIDMQPSTTATVQVNTPTNGIGHYITFRGGGASVLKNIRFVSGGTNTALFSSATAPQCDAVIEPNTQEPDLVSSIINIHREQSTTGSVLLENVTFETAFLNALYVGQPVTLTNVTFTNNPLGIVRDLRSGTNATVTKNNVTFSGGTIADEATMETVTAQNITGSLVAGDTALFCATQSAQTFSATATVTKVADGAENSDGTSVTDAVVRIALTDGSGTSVTNTTGAPLVFDVTFTNGTATGGASVGSGVDFNNTAQQVSIADGASTTDVTVPVFTDTLLESDETFTAVVTVPQATQTAGVTMATQNTASVTISDVTTTQATLQATDGAEGAPATDVTFTVSLDKTNATGAVIPFSLTLGGSGDTASAGVDYNDNSGVAIQGSIPNGSAQAVFTVPVLSDVALENTESVTATVTTTDSRVSLSTAQVTAQIIDPTQVTARLSAISGAEGGADVTFTVTLSHANMTGAPIAFDLIRSSGTAIVGDDYADTLGAQSISVAHNATAGVLALPVVDDALLEVSESITATLSHPSHAQIVIDTTAQNATAAIVDNDATTASVAVTQNGTEGASGQPISFTVALAKVNATGTPITFDVALGGTAVAGSDYTDTVSGAASAQIAVGKQSAVLTLPVIDDDIYEGDETILITLSNPSDANAVLGTDTATAIITDDDVPPLTARLSVVQNGAEATPTDMVFEVKLSGENITGAPITFDTAFVSGRATAGDDYGATVAGSATLVVPVGATTGRLTVPVVNDPILEGDEDVILNISRPSHTSVTIDVDEATATIIDDEVTVVAAENSIRDKDREDKKRSSKKKVSERIVAAAVAPVQTVADAVEPLVEERREVIPVAQTEEEIRQVPDENTLVWNRTRTIESEEPQVLGVQTEATDGSFRFLWVIFLLLLLLVIAFVTYRILRRVRDRQEEKVVHSGPWWEDKK